jgi:hypothetical protein
MSIDSQDPFYHLSGLSVSFPTRPCSYPPPILVKHAHLYFDDADLFICQREILYGLHQRHFNTPYFTQILTTIEPGRTAARGTVPTLPIPFNDISSFTFITFVSILYQPNDFHTHTQGWREIKKLADEWGYPHIWLRAEEKLREIDFFSSTPLQRLMRVPVQTRLMAEQTYIRWKIRHQPWDYGSVEDDSYLPWDYESDESVEDDSP